MEIFVLVMVLALAAANGANDVPKGVATLAGAGVARTRTAIIWGTIATAVGCLVSLTFAAKMTALFSKGIVTAKPTAAFAAAVLIGTVAWVVLATWAVLPVSTTQALTGALLGAGTIFASDAVQWGKLVEKVIQPMLLSVLVAWVISAVLSAIARFAIRRRASATSDATGTQPAQPVPVGAGAGAHQAEALAVEAPAEPGSRSLGIIGVAHWLTSGLTSFARGMNDAPKIVAIGSFALVGGMTPRQLLFGVTAAMAIGGLVAGYRIAERLATDVISMTHLEGFTANLTTAGLVGLGAFQGWPMSTTQVSIGAITGISGTDVSRIKKKTIRDFVIAWVVTPPFAAVVAALAFVVLR